MLRQIKYYFPAFVDFCRCVYRSGLISPQQRVMIRVLSCFSWNKQYLPDEHQKCRRVLKEANKFIGSDGLFNTLICVSKTHEILYGSIMIFIYIVVQFYAIRCVVISISVLSLFDMRY